MQAVQTWRCLRAPFTAARTFRRLGFQRRRRVLFAWLITLPNEGPLPHNSHFAILLTYFAKKLWWYRTSKCNRVSKNSVEAGSFGGQVFGRCGEVVGKYHPTPLCFFKSAQAIHLIGDKTFQKWECGSD